MSATLDDEGAGSARWLLLSVAAPPPGEAHLLVDALHRLGARSVQREGRRVLAVFPPSDDPVALAADAQLAVRASTSLSHPDVAWRRLTRDEWVARTGAGHPPVRVTPRIVVVVDAPGAKGGRGTGADREVNEADEAGEADLVVRLEPSSAFGTAEHATTRSCLRMLDGRVRPGDRVLDVGAGSGILAIAAVALGADRATALEADPVACAAARRNVALNGLVGRVAVREVRVSESLAGLGGYDGVVANLQAEIQGPLIPVLAAVPAPRRPGAGWLIVSGALRSERDGILAAAEAVGLRLEDEVVEDGWWTGRLARPVAPGVPPPGR